MMAEFKKNHWAHLKKSSDFCTLYYFMIFQILLTTIVLI